MGKNATTLIQQAKSWLGYREKDGTHRKIIDVYNSHRPLARNYRVKYTDSWCATFVSACAIKTHMTDIIPTECSCVQMVKLFQKKGEWEESDKRKPAPGDIIFYDWQDNGRGDNTGSPDHVGIVEKVSGTKITVIEGNKNDAVERRTLNVNGRYIRGYGVPKYGKETKEKEASIYYTIKKGDTLSLLAKKYQTSVSAIQKLNPSVIKNVNVIYPGQKIRIK